MQGEAERWHSLAASDASAPAGAALYMLASARRSGPTSRAAGRCVWSALLQQGETA
jgi:hypothetical protein